MIIKGTVEERRKPADNNAPVAPINTSRRKSNSFLITQIVPTTQNPQSHPITQQKQTGGHPVNSQSPQSSGLHPATEKSAPPAAAKIPLGNTRFSGTSGNPGLSGNPGTSGIPQTIRQFSSLKY